MNLLKKLWRDEAGVILSAEAAVVGTVAVLGVSAGLSVVATAVNDELKDVGFAIHSLDQSYRVPGQRGCLASTAGSSFEQRSVSHSLADLCAVTDKTEARERAERTEREYREDREEREEAKDHGRKKSKSEEMHHHSHREKEEEKKKSKGKHSDSR